MRPIPLLNIDYKLVLKSIANRVKPLLNKIISSDQTELIKGRYIGKSVRTLQEVIDYTHENNNENKQRLDKLCKLLLKILTFDRFSSFSYSDVDLDPRR